MVLSGRGVGGWQGPCRYFCNAAPHHCTCPVKTERVRYFPSSSKGLEDNSSSTHDIRWQEAHTHTRARFPTNQTSVLHRITSFSEILDEKRVYRGTYDIYIDALYCILGILEGKPRTNWGQQQFQPVGKKRVGKPRQSLTQNTNEFIRAMLRMMWLHIIKSNSFLNLPEEVHLSQAPKRSHRCRTLPRDALE